MGVHALSGVGSSSLPPVGTGVNAALDRGHRALGGRRPSSWTCSTARTATTSYTAAAGQTKQWDTNTTSGLNNLRGAGSTKTGASMVSMSWTTGATTNMALLGVNFNPGQPPPTPHRAQRTRPSTSATAGNGTVALAFTAPVQ